MKKPKILFLFGTRPEAIKMAPVIQAFRQSSHLETRICLTAQHRELLDQVMDFFGIVPDHDLNLMQPNQSLTQLSARLLTEIQKVLRLEKPDLVLVQGDTTSVMIGTLASYYLQIPVGHIEAGLRSFDRSSPFPEEGNRLLTSQLASLHFTPTSRATRNLYNQNIRQGVWQVGNSVVDALFHTLELLRKGRGKAYSFKYDFLPPRHKVMLFTCHRRESFGKPFQEICKALVRLIRDFPQLEILYPLHPNPKVREDALQALAHHDRIHLVPAVPYPELIWLMYRSHLVVTDSGGIQEEAPSLGKPILVTRQVTERMEGVHAGTAKLVGQCPETLYQAAAELLTDPQIYSQMAQAGNPYGDGTTAQQILEVVEGFLLGKVEEKAKGFEIRATFQKD